LRARAGPEARPRLASTATACPTPYAHRHSQRSADPAGDDLAGLLIAACQQGTIAPTTATVLVVAQKIVSKAEGRHVDLAGIRPTPRAQSLGAEVDKEPAPGRGDLGESRRVVRHRPGVRSSSTGSLHHGECRRRPLERRPCDRIGAGAAAAGRSGCVRGGIVRSLAAHFGKPLGVIITDSWGRAWRRGTVGVALGSRAFRRSWTCAGGRSCSARAARDPNRICRRDRQRRLLADGTGRRGAAAVLVRASPGRDGRRRPPR